MNKEEIADWHQKTFRMRERAKAFVPDFSDIYIESVDYSPGIIGMKGSKSTYANPWVTIKWRYNSWDALEEKYGDVPSTIPSEITIVSIDEFIEGWDN